MGHVVDTSAIIEMHQGVTVVRDDLYPGGTKARFIPKLFCEGVSEVVYASSAEGGAQVALATIARTLGKKATIFCAARAVRHARQLEAKRLGAKYVPVRPGYLNVIQSRARKYCEETGATLAPFGLKLPVAVETIAAAARRINVRPAQAWCAAGSGTLATALRAAWPDAEIHAVMVGHKLCQDDVAGATLHEFPLPYKVVLPASACPFGADGCYEIKAWTFMLAKRGRSKGPTVFWNVMGPASHFRSSRTHE
jgi:hypothetical protein